jgi:hypothetical protein
MDNIITIIAQSKEILAAIVALIMFAIVSYKQIMAEIARKESAAKKELANIVTGLITKAEEKPNEILNSLVNKEAFPPLLSTIPTPEIKENLVAQALQERNPSLLKKAKLKDVPAILSFIGNVYQGIKPVISLIRAKK